LGCILCRDVYLTAAGAQSDHPPAPEGQLELSSLGQTNTSVSRPWSPQQSDHSAQHCSVITHHCLLGKCSRTQMPVTDISITTDMCWKKTERVRKAGRVSEREGEVKTALCGTERWEERQETILLFPVED